MKNHHLRKFGNNRKLSYIMEATKHNRESEVRTNEGRGKKMDWALCHKSGTIFRWKKYPFWNVRSEDSRGVESRGTKG